MAVINEESKYFQRTFKLKKLTRISVKRAQGFVIKIAANRYPKQICKSELLLY